MASRNSTKYRRNDQKWQVCGVVDRFVSDCTSARVEEVKPCYLVVPVRHNDAYLVRCSTYLTSSHMRKERVSMEIIGAEYVR